MVLAIRGLVKCVVEVRNHIYEPGDDGQDFVCPDSLDGVRLSSSEGVCCRRVSGFDSTWGAEQWRRKSYLLP